MNDKEREEWVMNDEGLYRWFKSERKSMRNFLRDNRSEITRAIENVTSNRQPAHYLCYGGRNGMGHR